VKIIAASAALEIGAVRTMPNTTEMMTPIGIGCNVVAISRNRCSAAVARLMPGETQVPTRQPETIVTTGTIMMSTFVFPATQLPSSEPTTAARYAPTGPPSW